MTNIQLASITDAALRIRPHIYTTPLLPSESISQACGCDVSFKCENLQHVGAFKSRGAVNAVLSLDEASAQKGVVTHSSGNHAAALARAATIRRIAAHVVMPHNSAKTKIEAVRSWGVEPVFCEPTAADRQQAAEQVQRETGATFIHPYDDARVISGQGTVGLEVLEQLSDVDTLIVPVGGGGLLAGILTAVKALRPEVQVIAAEPAWADDTARSLSSGKRESPLRYDTIADGLRTPVGELTFPIIQSKVDGIRLVDEEAIVAAQQRIAKQARLVAEPSGAVALAALLANAQDFANQQVVCVITGGNADS